MTMAKVQYISVMVLAFITFQHVYSAPAVLPEQASPTAKQVLDAMRFLTKYKYMNIDANKNSDITSEMMIPALVTMQRFAGLEETGKLDMPTQNMMRKPRCGMADVIVRVNPDENNGIRVKRYNVAGVQRYRWPTNDVSYTIDNYPTQSQTSLNTALTNDIVDSIIADAFKVWSDASSLTFTRIQSNFQDADIHLLFGGRSHTNVFYDPVFDGKGGTLAHAFTPNSGWGDTNGDVHFDDDETFTHLIYSGTNLFYTAAHEIGHALGLDHSSNVNALMWPYDQGYQANFRLPADDIAGIQAIYGSKPTEIPLPPYCNITFNAVAVIFNKLHVFSDSLLWQFSLDGVLLTNPDGEDQRIYFKQLPRRIQAVYERLYDGKVVFLKGQKVYVYDGSVAETPTGGSYITSAMAAELPKSISAAVHDGGDGETDFLRGTRIWRYDEIKRQVVEGFPKRFNPDVFPKLPRKPTGAFVDKNDQVIVLKEREYYQYTRTTGGSYLLSIDHPQDFAQDYLRCP